MAKRAVEHIRRMRGGAQGHLMRCDDGNYYVVKFRNNPQGVRVLANEMLASKLALTLGLPASEPEVIEVSDWLIGHTPEMYMQCGADRVRCAAGLQFGSRFPCDPLRTPVYDFLPDALLENSSDRTVFPGVLVFDKWTCNCDARQLVFHRVEGGNCFAARMIDQGFCFNANNWTFPDSPLRGLYSRLAVYSGVIGWDSFEPFLSRVEHLEDDFLDYAAASVPPEWYDGRVDDLRALIAELADRRSRVGELLLDCVRSPKQPFPNWKADWKDGEDHHATV